jgi:hypothetical protein
VEPTIRRLPLLRQLEWLVGVNSLGFIIHEEYFTIWRPFKMPRCNSFRTVPWLSEVPLGTLVTFHVCAVHLKLPFANGGG